MLCRCDHAVWDCSNGIILIDFANQALLKPAHEAIFEACLTRFVLSL